MANNSNLPWRDNRPDAAWLATIWSVLDWQHAGKRYNPLFEMAGVSVHTCSPDWMHIKHLGTDKVILGSILYALVNYVMDGSPEENLAMIWGRIGEIYKERRTHDRYGALKMTMFTSKSSPKLKGKAAEVKNLAPVLYSVWNEQSDPNVENHRKMGLLLRLSIRLDDIVDNTAGLYKLPADDAAELVSTCHTFLCVWRDVEELFLHHDYALFHMTVKAHFLMHSCLQSVYMHPRMVWCYSGEDLMGKVRPLIRSSSRGCKIWQVSNKVLRKYLLALHMTLSNPRAWYKRGTSAM
jgi:hypothetical protein